MVPTEEMLTAPQTHGSIWKAILRERCPFFFVAGTDAERSSRLDRRQLSELLSSFFVEQLPTAPTAGSITLRTDKGHKTNTKSRYPDNEL